MAIKLINIGFGNIVSANRIISIVSPSQRRLNELFKKQGTGTCLSMLLMEEEHVLLLLQIVIMSYYPQFSQKQ